MKRFSTQLPTLALLGVLAACGGGDAPAADTDTDAAPAAAAAPTPAPAAGGLNCYVAGATLEQARQRPSPLTTTSLNLGPNQALLCYGSPAAGALPNGQPWAMGDNEATTLHLSSRANLGGVVLQPGSYSLYAIPGANEWEIFVNSNFQRPGMPIDAGVRATELGSFRVVPRPLPEPAARLTFEWEEAAGGEPGGEILLEWGTTLIGIPIEG